MISIVIPLYNKELSIKNTINSVLNQTFSEFEIVIVNDGSTDNSYEVVKEIDDNRIKLVNKENGGVCSARNRGIEESKYDFVAFLDADDIWEANYIEEQVKAIKDFPLAAMWGANYCEIHNNQALYLKTGLPNDFRGYVENYFGFKHTSDLFCSSSVVIKKEVFNKVGNFDTRIKYSEDLDMWYRIILNYPIVFNSTHLVSYIHDAENRAMNKKIDLNKLIVYYVEKYNDYCKNDKIFSSFIHTFAAIATSKYYFNNCDIEDAKSVIGKIYFKDIDFKYTLWYKTPYFIGRSYYSIEKLIKTAKNHIRNII